VGFWGSVVVARTERSLLDLVSVVERSESLDGEERHGPWSVGTFSVPDLESAAPDFQLALATETGAPVLTAFVLDSDTATIEAYHPSAGFWRACLARGAAARYWQDPTEFEQHFLPATAAAEHAIAWSRDAGLEPDAAQLHRVFAVQDADPLAEHLVHELIRHLGIEAATSEPPTAPAPAPPPAPSRARRRRHPVDALLQEHVVPDLTRAGFTRHGRRFRLRTPTGDALLTFDVSKPATDDTVTFSLLMTLTPAAWRDRWFCDDPDLDPKEVVPQGADVQLPVPSDDLALGGTRLLGEDRWEVDPRDEASVRRLRRALTEVVVPVASLLVDPRVFLDAVDDLRHPHLFVGPIDRLMALIDLGPTADLARVWAQCFDPADPGIDEDLRDWAEARLSSRFSAPSGWQHGPFAAPGPDSPRTRLRALTDQHLAPPLAAAGFTGREDTYQLHNSWGDQLVVETAPARTGSDQDLVFSVRAYLVPAMERRWIRDAPAAAPPPLLDGWCLRHLPPPPGHAHQPTQATLGLDLWHCRDDDGACGTALAQALTDALPTLLPLLDRRYLLGLVTDPATPRQDVLNTPGHAHSTIVLHLDADPQAARRALAAAEEDGMLRHVERDFLAWARTVL